MKGRFEREREKLPSIGSVPRMAAISRVEATQSQVSHMIIGIQGLEPSSTGHKQGTESEAEQPGHKPVPIKDACAAGRGLAYHGASPCKLLEIIHSSHTTHMPGSRAHVPQQLPFTEYLLNARFNPNFLTHALRERYRPRPRLWVRHRMI